MPILNNKQWIYPITPSGKASFLDVVTEPSHRISGDMTVIAFDADPAVVREFTPEPLEPRRRRSRIPFQLRGMALH